VLIKGYRFIDAWINGQKGKLLFDLGRCQP
jgi:hypothetical protein